MQLRRDGMQLRRHRHAVKEGWHAQLRRHRHAQLRRDGMHS